eukprot:4072659-Pleurochrysis_carterae.AAC.2
MTRLAATQNGHASVPAICMLVYCARKQPGPDRQDQHGLVGNSAFNTFSAQLNCSTRCPLNRRRHAGLCAGAQRTWMRREAERQARGFTNAMLRGQALRIVFFHESRPGENEGAKTGHAC